jgi:hypothetical protein
MTGEIDVEVRNIYGVTTHYPACPAAEVFARLAGTKTLTAHALRDIKALGFQVHYCTNINGRLIVIKSEAA